MAAMMGVMVVGGLLVGTGVMHGGAMMHQRAAPADSAEAFELRYAPARLLDQGERLELTAEQIAVLGALRDSVQAGSLAPVEAAVQARAALRPLQQAAVEGAPPPDGPRRHHE